MGKGTIVLAYSGGLDTSICIPLLKEKYDYDRVVTVAVNVGQRDAALSKFQEAHSLYPLDLALHLLTTSLKQTLDQEERDNKGIRDVLLDFR